MRLYDTPGRWSPGSGIRCSLSNCTAATARNRPPARGGARRAPSSNQRPWHPGSSNGMPPPLGFAVHHGHIGVDVLAGQQRHPHVSGRLQPFVLFGAMDRGDSAAHAPPVVDRFAEDRVARRRHAMGCGGQSLTFVYQQFTVDPAVLRIELLSIGILCGNQHRVAGHSTLSKYCIRHGSRSTIGMISLLLSRHASSGRRGSAHASECRLV